MSIQDFRRKRGAIKASLTCFIKFVDRIDRNVVTETVCVEVEERLDCIQRYYKEFEVVQGNIEALCENDDLLLSEYDERVCFENVYFAAIANARSILSKVDHAKDTNPFSQSCNSNNSVSLGNAIVDNTLKGVRLPVINLPNFSGQYDQWMNFKEMFAGIIHVNDQLTDVQKLQYLKVSLCGQAAEIIKSIEVCANNYKVAWDLLCKRYDNRRILITNHIKALFNLPVVKNESAGELRRLVDGLNKHLMALEALNQPIIEWGLLIIYIVCTKLDNNTKRDWEMSKLSSELPILEEIRDFLNGRCAILETLENQGNNKRGFSRNESRAQGSGNSLASFISTKKLPDDGYKMCHFCKKNDHYINSCATFLSLDTFQRSYEVKKRRLCLNCLKPNHFSANCKNVLCKICGKRHNVLLHYKKERKTSEECENAVECVDSVKENPPTNDISSVTSVVASCGKMKQEGVLLSTARVKAVNNNCGVQCRALLDCGSEGSFITTELCEMLDLSKRKVEVSVLGIGKSMSPVKYQTEVLIKSCDNKYQRMIKCLVIDNITETIPPISYSVDLFRIPTNIKLADSNFSEPGKIHILLGANVFWELLLPERKRVDSCTPILQNTVLGWVLAGPFLGHQGQKGGVNCNFTRQVFDIQDQLRQFWEIEDVNDRKSSDDHELICEKHFKNTLARSDDGNFVVSIPLKDSPSVLGGSIEIAERRFYSVEKRLERNTEMYEQYRQFMKEYELLGHMSKVKDVSSTPKYMHYLPHHGVIKDDSITTKLRVVFDGSCPTTSGRSLNSIQHVGPSIQQELFNLLVRFRYHKYVVSGDVEKMYRCVLVKDDERDLQRILWRENRSDELKHYRLNTVTYGLASSSFLAIRALQETAYENAASFPEASKVILQDFYVDDLLSGTDTISGAVDLVNDVTNVLSSGGFKLRKWISNSNEVVASIGGQCSDEYSVLGFGERKGTKTLGVVWWPYSDTIRFVVPSPEVKDGLTKREILSVVSKIYDPLGLVGPCIVLAKMLLQALWKEKLGWDDQVSKDVEQRWKILNKEFFFLNSITIPRRAISNNRGLQLHIFSDASERAYGACVYVRSVDSDSCISTHLLCSKSRVAPIKRLTIPKLELCAAVIAAKLGTKVIKALDITFEKVFYWCDSMIVLSWIKTEKGRLKSFEANRVEEIQKNGNGEWHYVSTGSNPADLISRGILPSKLAESWWWSGPDFLRQPQNIWPCVDIEEKQVPELKDSNILVAVCSSKYFSGIWEISESVTKIQRVVAWCLRFSENCKIKDGRKSERKHGLLSVQELYSAMKLMVKSAQEESFPDIMKSLKADSIELNKSNHVIKLSPFLDEDGLIRVGGRLQQSSFNYNKKHPWLLDGKHIFTERLLKREHERLLHAGPQLMLASIRDNFWPINGRNACRKITYKCIKCFKANPAVNTQLMGSLPKYRLESLYPFYSTGIDYAGPIMVKDRRGRGSKLVKCYVCLFICMATKAVHIELVSDLTTESFIACLRRFCARRGKPAHIYSDNGRTFVGAKSELKDLGNFLIDNAGLLADNLGCDNIAWHFIPACSPHFGGLWEAGVKSTKYHLRRVLGGANVVYEDLLTVLIQIESILNSRPMCPLSSSPNDLQSLSPSHFLLGRKTTSVCDPDLQHIKVSRLAHFQQLQSLVHQFWRRWSKEYVSELQQRQCWKLTKPNIEVGQLVLLKEDNSPPLSWRLARITEVHKGSDGLVRVVTIRTTNGVYKRAISKICPLPLCPAV